MKALIIGCGYVGLPLALRWQTRGWEIAAWVHSLESAAALREHRFAQVIIGSVADGDRWNDVGPCDVVIHCASSGRGGADAYREVFLEGARMVCARRPAARRIFVSSTSVYGQTQGETVAEDSPAEPATDIGKILRQAEDVALAAGAIVLRSSGIYGPGRAALHQKFLRGEAIVEGDSSRWINQVHRDDLVAAIELVAGKGRPGEIYNVTDDAPVAVHDFYAWCAETSGRPTPPRGPVNPSRKRGLTSKRVSNAKLRALGWRPVYPSFREGLCREKPPAIPERTIPPQSS